MNKMRNTFHCSKAVPQLNVYHFFNSKNENNDDNDKNNESNEK